MSLGPVSIPTSSLTGLMARLLQGPVLSLNLRPKEDYKEGSRFFLTASLSGRLGSKSWIVDDPVPIEKLNDRDTKNKNEQ
jgi:hypothetical protein